MHLTCMLTQAQHIQCRLGPKGFGVVTAQLSSACPCPGCHYAAILKQVMMLSTLNDRCWGLTGRSLEK